MKEIIGRVTQEEREEIKLLFGRKNALADLIKSVGKDAALYEKIMNDYMETSEKFRKWWDVKSHKYSWKGVETAQWEINFDTCEIFLVNNT